MITIRIYEQKKIIMTSSTHFGGQCYETHHWMIKKPQKTNKTKKTQKTPKLPKSVVSAAMTCATRIRACAHEFLHHQACLPRHRLCQ